MTSPRWRQIEQIYHAAREETPSARRALLDQACGGDEDLRRQVEALLAESSPDGDFLERPAMVVAAQMTRDTDLPSLIGRRLGVFEIRSLLGTGGMGEVYRARDTRLGRDVAVKVLPRAFATDPERLARFEREARVLASLNHPNIGGIYGIEETTNESGEYLRTLILELVEGQTLADRLARGPLKIHEATSIAVQIADALDVAHERGIVHRDLKPANLKITPEGTVKVLDFGLATAVSAPSAVSLTDSPTLPGERTQPGTVLGTLSYMSPEQARGQPVDRRTDVWAFGCVLFEMLTGRPAFPGATMPDIIAKILERDPDWEALPAATPDAVHRVLRWALVKNPQRRLRDVADARLELETSATETLREDLGPVRRRWPAVAAWIAAVIVSVIVGAAGSRRLQTPAPESTHLTSQFAIPVGPLEVLPRNVSISPDGRYVAYLAGPPGNQKTYLRAVGDRVSRVIAELPMQPQQPFFSPDSQWIAFFDAGKLKKLAVGGGSPVTLAEAPTPRGGTWGQDGSIVFAPISRGGLMWLAPAGGPPIALTSPDDTRGETSHRFPAFLPQSHTVLFVAESNSASDRSLQAVSLDTKQVSIVSTGDTSNPRYVPTGYLAYLVSGKLVAAPFDVATMRMTSAPVTFMEGVDSFSFSSDGTLVYSDAPAYNVRASTLVWTDRDGSVNPLPLPAAVYDHPRLSADGRSFVVDKQESGDRNLWLYDTGRDTLSKFTLTSSNDWPVWTADGKRIIYASNRPGTQWDIFSKPFDGSGPERALLARPLTQIPRAVSPLGDTLIFEESYADRPNTLWRMPVHEAGEPRPLFASAAGEMMPTFSPDGRWVAYVSPQSARNEVYVRSSTGEGSTWQISNDSGVEPVWSFSGRELFYRANDKMMVVDVDQSPNLSFGKPRVLFEGSYIFGNTEGQEFDVSRDGRRFLMLKPQRVPAPTPLSVIVNWFDDLGRRVPASR